MNKTVLITGGSRGIGRSTAIEFAKAGYRTIITYFSSKQSADELKSEYGIHSVYCDARESESINNALKEIHKNYGKVGTLVNCAGIALKQKPICCISEREFDGIMQTNVKSVFNFCKAVLPDMLDLGGGAIVNVSSIWGLDGGSCETIYSASKGAITAFTKSFAKEVAPSNIRVNEVAPGLINTDMNAHLTDEEKRAFCDSVALNRVGEPQEVAKVILFLASESASYITAQTIRVDGGMLP